MKSGKENSASHGVVMRGAVRHGILIGGFAVRVDGGLRIHRALLHSCRLSSINADEFYFRVKESEKLISVMKWAVVLAVPLFGSAHADTLYLCQSYGGGQFWSSANCHGQSATVKRMVTVPDGLPFDQQVQLGEQQRAEGKRLAIPAARQPSASNRQTSAASGQCVSIANRIRALDGMARQPQTMQTQDYIRRERKQLTDEQYRLHC